MLKKRKERNVDMPLTFMRGLGEVRFKIKKLEFPHFIGEVML